MKQSYDGVDPAFRSMHPHSMKKLIFYLFIWRIWFFFLKTWSYHLFLFYFFKAKQSKKENLKYDSLFGKDNLWKTKIGFGGQVTHQEGTAKNRSTPLSPQK